MKKKVTWAAFVVGCIMFLSVFVYLGRHPLSPLLFVTGGTLAGMAWLQLLEKEQ